MKIGEDCIVCALNTYIRVADKFDLQGEKREQGMRDFLGLLKDYDYNKTSPDLGRDLHNLIKRITGDSDPYRDEKSEHNSKLMDKYDSLLSRVRQAEDSFLMALRLSMVGNLIDLGVCDNIDVDYVVEMAEKSEFGVDDSKDLGDEIEKAGRILYLGDNAGEIVMDKLFIEVLGDLYKDKKIVFVVRSEPIINDATLEDVRYTGLDKLVRVIENGYDAPGTILEECSKEFLSEYERADVIISKGQGNYESLSERDENIFFLLTAKCDIVANSLNTKKGSLVTAMQKKIRGTV